MSVNKAIIAWKPFGNHPRVASARLRSFLPCRYLKQAGWPCELFQPEHLQDYRVVIFQKAYQPQDYQYAQRLKEQGAAVVFDLCDNHFYNPTDDPALAQRRQQLEAMIALADIVTVSTPTLAEYIPDKPTLVIDDAIDDYMRWLATHPVGKMALATQQWGRGRHPLKLVWFGNAGSVNPPFGLIDLERLGESLNALHAKTPIELTVISNSRPLFEERTRGLSFPTRYVKWTHRGFPFHFVQHDICLLPITPNPFTQVKTNNRLLLSLLMGVPVIADPIPSYREFEPYALFSDWHEHLRMYASDLQRAKQHANAGKRYILETYTTQRVVSQWERLLEMFLS